MDQAQSWARRLAVVAVMMLVLAAAWESEAQAAEVVAGAAGAACQITLKGPIAAGDSEKLKSAFDALPSEFGGESTRLCLNSPGGDYYEGLSMIWMMLRRTNVATIVDRGAECFSACAFMFLAGNTPASEDGEMAPDRTLDAGGTLGFHAPYLTTPEKTGSTAVSDETFRQGVSAIAQMLEIDRRELFPRGLLAKALQVGPGFLLYIDTIEKIGVWSIKLKGYRRPAQLTDTMLDQACRNKDVWTNYSHSFLGRPADDPDQLHGISQSDFPEIRGEGKPIKLVNGKFRLVLDLFGHEATNNCIVDVYSDAKNGLFLSLAMAPVETPPTEPDQFALDVTSRLTDPASLDLVAAPLWYAYAPATTMKSIAAAP
ncbi:MAG: hypothetical protein ACKVP4_03265 [Hyphomicrobium sp.]